MLSLSYTWVFASKTEDLLGGVKNKTKKTKQQQKNQNNKKQTAEKLKMKTKEQNDSLWTVSQRKRADNNCYGYMKKEERLNVG